ncbi:endonuclease/exonuclease/phosphatase family protein [Salinibacter grassmerensis]|uniref:endonuclease/exonuclease/phosphatase family protein n=1 Tax=Salinibacter grassmerensis TaxID=3040353 RepID=UPI0021E8866C|nr:endonuclease/exonuclease/phosphatase family protein [Salinibacter grassmerensis]
MKRAAQIVGLVVGGVLLGVAGFFVWASSGALSGDELAQVRTYTAEPDTTQPDTLTVTTYNIGYLSGMRNNEPVVRPDSLFYANMDQAVGFLQEAAPDIVGLQEIDFGGARAAHVHQLDTLAARLGYAGAAQAVNWDERYLPFPYGRPAVHFGRTLSGQAVLSHRPVRRHARTTLPRPSQPFFRDAFYLDRLAQVGVVDVGGHPLAVINVHLEAFDVGTREKQARIVNDLYRRLASNGIPALLLGDFNSSLSSDGETGQAGAKDATMQYVLDGTDLRSAVNTASADTASATYPADTPARKIDHIFYPPQFFEVVGTKRWCGAPRPPSDHCAVTASLRLTSPAEWPSHEALPSLGGQSSK